ncbi:MAG: hypothetical protein GX593_09645 [Actinomycetales bacterium]|nr:hypothetical protein [Actinomycetales bacterium]
MAHIDPDRTEPTPTPLDRPALDRPTLDPVAASEPTPMPQKKRSWWSRFFRGTGAVAGNPAGPAQQTGGTPAP